jgi:uncharacterized protein (TIGR02145 family)
MNKIKIMKKIIMLIIITLAFGIQVIEAQTTKLKIGTNPTNINSSAALEIQSTNQGFLPPRMGLSQITAIATPAQGLWVYCTDCIPTTLLSFDGFNWVNAIGQQPVVLSAPSVPGTPVATAGIGSASVAFTAPTSSGSAAITSYTVVSFPGGLQATGTSSPITINGLTAGTSYTFTVRATNASGLTSTSASSNGVTPTASVPGTVTAVTATAGTGTTASVAFTAPANNGGASITGYTVTSSPGAITATGTTSPITISGLSLGSSYTFTVVATNAQGNSTASTASNSIAIAATVPNAPTVGTATISGTTAQLAFTAPANTGGATITGYTVTSTPGGILGTGSASSINIPGLTAGTNYSFKVTATNSVGTSAASAASNFVQAASAPSVPSGLSVTAISGTSATISFAASNSNGSAVTTYTVTPSPATTPATFTASSSPITVTGLTTGTNYTFSVTATNALGTSASGTATYTPQNTVPSPPSGVAASAGNASASITFTAPSSNGGAIITGYTVTSSPGGITATGITSPITVSGIANGTAYTFTVVATNSVGNSISSSPSNSVTPVAVPVPMLTATNLTASAAYSLRKLTSSYSGAAVRVRRSSDNTEQDIPFTTSGDLDTAQLTTFVGTGDGYVSVWYDQSGNATNAIQTTLLKQPKLINSGVLNLVNNRPAILFNGSQNFSTSSSVVLTSSSGWTSNCVAMHTSSSANMHLIDMDPTPRIAQFIRIYANNYTSISFNSAGNVLTTATGPIPPVSSLNLLTVVADSNKMSVICNGVAGTDAPTGSPLSNFSGILSIGCRNGSNFLIGSMNEAIIFNTALASNSLSDLQTRQASYYSVGIANVISPPPPPINTTALAGNASATVSFTPSAGATSYTVTSSPGGLTATASSSPIQVNGLTNGTAYTFTVTATNSNGTSAASQASTGVTPSAGVAGQTVANAPTIGVATAGTNSASIAFTASTNNGNSTITGYTATSSPGGITATGTTSPITVNGLTANTSYTFTVVATNSVGNSLSSAVSNAVTVFGVPSKPVLGTPTAVGLSVSIPVTASTNGATISTYTATANPGNLVFTSTVAPVLISLPANGTYSITVTATNTAGTSIASDPVSISVAALTNATLASTITTLNSSGQPFNTNTNITATSLVSVGIICPSTVTWQGVTYPTVNISGMCWMKTNFQGSNSLGNATFFGGGAAEPSAGWGKLYDNTAVMNGSTAERAQGICPTGWHVPSDLEWNYLEHTLGATITQQTSSAWGFDKFYDTVGYQSQQSNSLALVLSGQATFGSPTTYKLWDPSGLYWTSTNKKIRWVAGTYTTIYKSTAAVSDGVSLRCLKD